MPEALAIGVNVTTMVVVGLVVLLLFGAKKIPELMRSMGSGLREFKRGMDDGVAEPHDVERR